MLGDIRRDLVLGRVLVQLAGCFSPKRARINRVSRRPPKGPREHRREMVLPTHSDDRWGCGTTPFATFLCCLIHHRRHLLRLFFGVIAAVETFGAVLVEPCHNPMKLDHRTPSVSGLPLVFGFAFAFGHAQPRAASRGAYQSSPQSALPHPC